MEADRRAKSGGKEGIFVILAVLAVLQLCCSGVWARPMTAREAQQAATGWLRVEPHPLETTLGGQVAKVETFEGDDGEPVYYIVYLEPAGFVIVPADDLVEPIVGFVDDGTYDPSPTNPLGALVTNDLNGRIAAVRNVKGLEASGRMEEAVKCQAKWSELISLADSGEDGPVSKGLGSISDVRVAPLVQSRWEQRSVCEAYCYNYYTPNHYPCGCVATATAQLMRYHEHPNDGPKYQQCTFQVNGVEQKAYPLGGDGSGGPYNWSQMPLVPDCSLTTAQREAIGALCFDAGISTGTKYTSSGSEGRFDDWSPLKGIFKYSNTIKGYVDNQNIERLVEMINPNLDGKHPVLLGIAKGIAGHAVVCDGYGYDFSTMYHHINMGWAGLDDAWYNLPNIDSSPPYDSVPYCHYNIFTTGSGEVISGRVLETNGDPIANATVLAGESGGGATVSTRTDSRGIYAFLALNSNTTYGIIAFAGGCNDSFDFVETGTSQSYQVTSGNVWGVDLVLTRFDLLHVDDNAPGDPGPGDPAVSDPWEDGSVEHPLDSIQEAIDAAVNGNTIEVAPGTYNEAINFKGKAVHLYSSDGLEVTIIDGTGLNTSIVTCASGEGSDTVLEGFKITGGNAEHGAGMSNNGSSPTVINCTFSGNTGGADGLGGGMLNLGSSPTVTNCTFSGNSANQYGGGMFNGGSSPTVTKCTFSGNESSYGGGMYNGNNSNPTVTSCTFTGNSDWVGGGMFNQKSSSPTVTNCTFSGNTGGYGGGMCNNYYSNPTVTNCSFTSNSAVYNGTNGGYGAGMFNYEFASPILVNCTFNGNTADKGGGGISNSESSPTLANCILWGDTPNEILDYDSPASTTSASFSDVAGGWSGTGNINADPLFVDAAGGNLRLSAGSPCIDAGDNGAVPADTADLDGDGNTAEPIPLDLDGRDRIVDGDVYGGAVVDMGAFELHKVHNITIDRWYATIQSAIEDANDREQIEVAPGTYYEAIDFKGKAITLRSSDPNDPNIVAATVIDANGLGSSVVTCNSSEGASTILAGFTITGGSYNNGGGMYNDHGSPTVTNCTFSVNQASGAGGGMLNYYCSPTVTKCTFTGNEAGYDGGGMWNYGSSPTVTNCTFSGNSAANNCGGMCNNDSSPTVTNCTFSGNQAGGTGGGMLNWYSNSTVTNCMFNGNSANQYGGGMCSEHSSPTVTNCTFSGNSATDVGGGMYNYVSSNPTITNCIFWGNTATSGPEIYDDASSSTTVSFSDVAGGWTGPGNINADPLFVDAAGGDLRLSSVASPCVDTGDNSAPNLPPTDLGGNPRVVDGNRDGSAVVDMGAYEFQGKVRNITRNLLYDAIQSAIDDASPGEEIEAAPGTYYEAIDFKGKAVRVYSSGGADVTTIDGTGYYHVLQCVSGEDANTILEGFTITGGNASGTDSNSSGGGMFNHDSSPTVTNCTFSGNSANGGGGMFNWDNSSPTVTNCTFSGNSTIAGGGMLNWYNSNPTVTNCTFSGNSAALGYGGGMLNQVDSSPTVTNCTFSNNDAGDNGGGMWNQVGSSPTVTNCTFSSNSAADYGGGMCNWENSSPTVTNCTFSNNDAGDYGGGMFNLGSNPRVTNCTFSGNEAGYEGGGMWNYGSSNPTITNCILWGDTPDEIYNISSSPSVTYSDLEGGWTGTGNINADPLFVDAAGGNLRLSAGSACIDAGYNAAVPADTFDLDNDGNTTEPIPWDLDGRTRFVDGDYNDTITVDMGAYEYGSTGIIGVEVDMDEFWMYQSIAGQSNSDLTAGVSITDDPMGNMTYSYAWEILPPGDVTLAPVTVDGGGAGDAYWTFAARGCD
ncbi:MAG: right-handed parallel beta-helix repeat-containing protein, partial [Planctomycetota bacterium]